MRLLPEGTISGHYPPTPDESLVQADSIVVQELGSDPRLTSNLQIVDRLDLLLTEPNVPLEDYPLFVSGSIAKILKRREENNGVAYNVEQVFEGSSADNHGENLGTYGELQQFRESGRERPIFVTSGYNVGNIVRQANKLGITEGMVPRDLPRRFDSRSEQLWTKNHALWVIGAVPRIGLLALKGH